MAVHVAIVSPPYDRFILEGRKRIESRFTRTDRPPFGCVRPGDRLCFKRSGSRFFADAEADRVLLADQLTPQRVDALVAQYNEWICGEAAYWEAKREQVRYATLIWLRNVRPTDRGPRYKPVHMRAWYVLEDDALPEAPSLEQSREPRFEVTLTNAAIRQRSVRVARHLEHLPSACLGGPTRAEAGAPLQLTLADGPTVETDVDSRRRMIRWRGWGAWFEQCGLRGGDRLQFLELGPRHFLVRPHHDGDRVDAD